MKTTICLFLTLASHVLQAATGYLVHNLVADDKSTATADFYDARLINPWGNVATTTSPLWVCDLGLSTIYTVNATNATPMGTPNATTQPTVPGAGGSKGSCTGIVANITPATTPPTFPVTAPGKAPVAASFIFVSEDGVLSAWAGGADATQALTQMDNSSSAVYKGLALVITPTVQLYAANFKSGGIDVFDAQFKPVTMSAGSFVDPKVPAGFAPFNIWNLGGKLYVAYAKQDANKKFDVPAPGNGYVSVFDSTGKLLQSLVAGGTGSLLNSPWGLAIAPATFGKFANDLLVGNFGDGLINAYDPTTGAFQGTLQDPSGKNIAFPGLWSLYVGNGGNGGDKDTVYFTAGPGGQKHGILGSIQANPNVAASGITNAAQIAGGVAPNTFITIKGTNLAATKRSIGAADIVNNLLPTSVDGVTVTINGQPAFITYISPVQINLVTPVDFPTSGLVTVAVSSSSLTSTTVNVTSQPLAPALFLIGAYGAALHANNSVVGPTTLVPNNSTPAAPGETIVLFGTGFGVTTPGAVSGGVVSTAAPLLLTPAILFDNVPGKVVFAGLIATGVYQFNVVVPSGLPDGDVPVVASTGGYSSPALVLTSIKN
ncbi:MAG TPA: TIGR03118 family protein [Candidatus Acidoferrum sp.]|nr:TIGR03118 family protein [Candidatus Acidoferrum sp.]